MPVRSKSTLADLKPCSVVLYIDKTLEKNNSDKGAITRGSKDTNASNFGQTAAPISAQQSACNLKVPENPLRTSSKLQSQIRDADVRIIMISEWKLWLRSVLPHHNTLSVAAS